MRPSVRSLVSQLISPSIHGVSRSQNNIELEGYDTNIYISVVSDYNANNLTHLSYKNIISCYNCSHFECFCLGLNIFVSMIMMSFVLVYNSASANTAATG